MPVGFDNTLLSILLNPHARVPLDPATSLPVTEAKRRAEYLVGRLANDREKIIIPTPVAAELLTAIGPEAQQYFDIINGSRAFEEAAFDIRCAMELAILNRSIFQKTDKRNRVEPYQRVKFDRQILAILRVAHVTRLYTDDAGLAARARLCGMTPIGTHELPLPPRDRQMRLQLEADAEIPEPEDEEAPEKPSDAP